MSCFSSYKDVMDVFTKMFEGAGGKGLDTAFTIDSFEVVGDYIYITGQFKVFTKGEKKLVNYCKYVLSLYKL